MPAPGADPMHVPAVLPQPPLCPLCHNEVADDGDGLVCEPCGLQWPRRDIGEEAGELIDPAAPRCESIDGRYLPGGAWSRTSQLDDVAHRCMRRAGNHRDHQWCDPHPFAARPLRGWRDQDAATPDQLAWLAARTPS